MKSKRLVEFLVAFSFSFANLFVEFDSREQMDLPDRKNLTFIFISNAQFMQILKIFFLSAKERSTNSPLSLTYEDYFGLNGSKMMKKKQ